MHHFLRIYLELEITIYRPSLSSCQELNIFLGLLWFDETSREFAFLMASCLRALQVTAILNRSERNLRSSNRLFEFGKREESTMAEREVVAAELRFRIFDGTDIAHDTYLLSTTIESLKERVVAEWPQG